MGVIPGSRIIRVVEAQPVFAHLVLEVCRKGAVQDIESGFPSQDVQDAVHGCILVVCLARGDGLPPFPAMDSSLLLSDNTLFKAV